MNYIERIKAKTDTIDLKKPIFKIVFDRDGDIDAVEDDWSTGLSDNDILNTMINKCARRTFDKHTRTYCLNISEIQDHIRRETTGSLIDMFICCSPYDQPRRTNIYKSFYQTVKSNLQNQEFLNNAFNICEYYYDSTRTDSIKHPDNDVHKKNIYQLLCLMEKKYGKSK